MGLKSIKICHIHLLNDKSLIGSISLRSGLTIIEYIARLCFCSSILNLPVCIKSRVSEAREINIIHFIKTLILILMYSKEKKLILQHAN